jgi:hypothetical protein
MVIVLMVISGLLIMTPGSEAACVCCCCGLNCNFGTGGSFLADVPGVFGGKIDFANEELEEVRVAVGPVSGGALEATITCRNPGNNSPGSEVRGAQVVGATVGVAPQILDKKGTFFERLVIGLDDLTPVGPSFDDQCTANNGGGSTWPAEDFFFTGLFQVDVATFKDGEPTPVAEASAVCRPPAGGIDVDKGQIEIVDYECVECPVQNLPGGVKVIACDQCHDPDNSVAFPGTCDPL